MSETLSRTSSNVADQANRELVARIATSDEAALSELYDRFAPTLYSIALRLTGEQADAEEVVLDTFSQAWREADRFRQERGSVIAWLTMICRSRALDLLRAGRRRARLADQVRAGASSTADSAESNVLQTERCQMVAEALSGLPDPQQVALRLAYFEGLSQSEIAERLGEPLGTVKTRVRAAMQKLREVLRPYYFESDL
jgi:RNA polymerase sigma-70 factor (ECF subfamily)